MTKIELTVDGARVSDDVEPRMLLVQYLREKLGKTGTVIGCDTSNCGACTVHLDGRSVKSCNVLAVQADGSEVTTVEGLAQDGQLHPVQEAFRECHGLQCGFCTPGMIMQSVDLLNENPNPTEEEVRLGLEGNLCRCTGYHNIVKSVLHAAGGSSRGGGDGMTATQERPADRARDRQGPPAQGGPAPHHRPHPLDRQHHPARDAAPRDGAQPVRAREDHRHRHCGRQGRDQRRRRPHRQRPRPTARASSSTPGRSPRTRSRRRTCRCRSTGPPSPARSWPWSSPARRPRPATRPSSSTSTARSCRPRSTSRSAAPRTRCLAHPDLGTNKSAFWKFDSAEAGTGGNVDEEIAKARDGGIVIEREYRQQRLIPAFMEPRSTVVDPTGEQITMWTARPRSRTSCASRWRRRPACPSRRSASSRPTSGGGFGGKLQTTPEEFITFAVARRLGKPVKYTETRSESLLACHHGRDQWQKLTLAAREGRHGDRASRSSCWPTSAPTTPSSAAARRCSARSCSTRSTSSRPTSSTSRRC